MGIFLDGFSRTLGLPSGLILFVPGFVDFTTLQIVQSQTFLVLVKTERTTPDAGSGCIRKEQGVVPT